MPKPWTTKEGDIKTVTAAMAKAMRPMSETDSDFIEQFNKAKRKRGRPAGRNKTVVSLSLDQDMVQALRSSGAGWQSRVNALLRAAMGLQQ